MRSAKIFLNQRSLKFFYHATFHSNLVYANPIWTSTFESNLKTITVKQKAAIRIISAKTFNAHTEPLFKEQKILPFVNLTTFFRLQFMQRFKQGFLPQSFENTWVTNRIRREGLSLIHI